MVSESSQIFFFRTELERIRNRRRAASETIHAKIRIGSEALQNRTRMIVEHAQSRVRTNSEWMCNRFRTVSAPSRSGFGFDTEPRQTEPKRIRIRLRAL